MNLQEVFKDKYTIYDWRIISTNNLIIHAINSSNYLTVGYQGDTVTCNGLFDNIQEAEKELITRINKRLSNHYISRSDLIKVIQTGYHDIEMVKRHINNEILQLKKSLQDYKDLLQEVDN